MAQYILKRVGLLIAVVFSVTVLCFLAVNIQGDPLVTLGGPACDGIFDGGGDPDFIDECRRLQEDFNLDDPMPVRYGKWVGGMVTGDFGRSLPTRTEVTTIFRQKFPKTIVLAVYAQVIALVVAIPWAVNAARRANKGFDKASTIGSFALIALPSFALGPVLKFLFAARFEIFPSSFEDGGIFTVLRSMFLPSLTLGLALAAGYQRLLRTDLGATLQEDFILMAKAKGMSTRRIMWGHALRSSLFSIVTVFAINTGALIGGALVVERIFAIPGMGFELAEAAIREDFTVVLGGVVVISVGFVMLNILADILYAVIDPRVRND